MELNSETIRELESKERGDDVNAKRLRLHDNQIDRLEVHIFDKLQML